jgi:dTDP-4-amino-4,6-dideoxygalactose transaminase
MSKPIPYGRQEITQCDIDAVIETLQSDFLTQGPKIQLFENEFAQYVDSKYAVAVSNGTAALHLCTLALGIKSDEYVICTPITFAASVNCVKYCGGNVLFADIDPDTYLMDIESVKSVLDNNTDKKIVGIIIKYLLIIYFGNFIILILSILKLWNYKHRIKWMK